MQFFGTIRKNGREYFVYALRTLLLALREDPYRLEKRRNYSARHPRARLRRR